MAKKQRKIAREAKRAKKASTKLAQQALQVNEELKVGQTLDIQENLIKNESKNRIIVQEVA